MTRCQDWTRCHVVVRSRSLRRTAAEVCSLLKSDGLKFEEALRQQDARRANRFPVLLDLVVMVLVLVSMV